MKENAKKFFEETRQVVGPDFEMESDKQEKAKKEAKEAPKEDKAKK